MSVDGTPLVCFKLESAPIGIKGTVEVKSSVAAAIEVPLLTLLGWYLIVLSSFRVIEPAASLWSHSV